MALAAKRAETALFIDGAVLQIQSGLLCFDHSSPVGVVALGLQAAYSSLRDAGSPAQERLFAAELGPE